MLGGGTAGWLGWGGGRGGGRGGRGRECRADGAAAPATIKTGLMLSASDTGFYVGIEQGYFAEQGLTIDITPIQAAATMLAPLAAGQIDAGGTTLIPGFMNAIARDVRIWAVADKGSTPPGVWLWASSCGGRPDNGTVHSAADLRGRKVSVPSRGSGAQASLDKALRREGLTTDDVDITPLNFPDMEAGFAGGAIDGAIVIEPFLSSIVDHGVGHLYARNDEYYPTQQVAVGSTPTSLRASSRDVARRLMIGCQGRARLQRCLGEG